MPDVETALLVRGNRRIALHSMAAADGLDAVSVVPHLMDTPEGQEALVTENWRFAVKESRLDDLSDRVQRIIDVLRYAWRYSNADDEIQPVYLAVRVAGESEFRFALVHSSPAVALPHPSRNTAVAIEKALTAGEIPITRFSWQAGIPGIVPSASTLLPTNGPTNPTRVHVANYLGGAVSLTHIFNFRNVGSVWSGNLFGTTGHPIWQIGGTLPAVGDIVYFGQADATPKAFGNIIIPIGNVFGVYSADVVVEYYNGSWVPAALGTKSTVFPSSTTEDDLFKIANVDHVINVGELSDWTSVAVNGVAGLWIRARLNAVTSFTTAPVVGSTAIYNQRSPEVRIPASSVGGDGYPLVIIRSDAPTGGNDDESFSNLSKLIAGYKSKNLAEFVSHLNLSDTALPSGWTRTLGTDATQVSDPLGPSGIATNVSFATQISLQNRIRLVGTSKLSFWRGTYQAYVRVRQIGGSVGDINLQLYVRERGISVSDPAVKSDLFSPAAVNAGLEIVSAGLVEIPFSRTREADSLSLDLIFELHVQRVSGSATIRLYDLILIPLDEWSGEYGDPLRDLVSGTSAIRGSNSLEIDSGIISPRVVKMNRSDSGIYNPLETWLNGGLWPKIKPGVEGRLFFLMGHFRAGGLWGTGPMIGSVGMHLSVQIYIRNRYYWLRGSRS